ncbi:MAG TPA: HAD family hydrolase [Acidimicrobiales bacterium]|nr:HAD family hydrolase [Acidimicrobiales bacterium]
MPAGRVRHLAVFDIDDTLYLERDYVRSGFAAVGAWAQTELGVADLGDRAWAAFVAGVRGRIFDEALVACGVPADETLVPRLVDVYRSHAPAIELLDDVRTWLAGRQVDVALAVVTDGPRASQLAKAAALGLEGWADPVVITEDLGPGHAKPHPAAFACVEAATGLAGTACAYVADNPAKDFAGPRARGWRTVRVRRVGALHAAVASRDDVDAEVTDFATLDEALGWRA